MLHGNMGIQLVKLNETIGRIFKVKNIPKMLENHVRKPLCKKMGHVHER
jgi:hypothetical protein